MSLVERTRAVIASEGDDFFGENGEIVDYLNASKRKTVSALSRIEEQSGRSLRVLDSLRKQDDLTLSSFTFDEYWTGTVNFPADLFRFDHLRYRNSTLRELSPKRLYLLQQGNVIPTEVESYFSVTGRQWEIYLYEDPKTTAKLYYLSEPSTVLGADTEFNDLPDFIETAVIYGAAWLMALKEGSEFAEGFKVTHNEEIETNAI